jgi:hypothetical protein
MKLSSILTRLRHLPFPVARSFYFCELLPKCPTVITSAGPYAYKDERNTTGSQEADSGHAGAQRHDPVQITHEQAQTSMDKACRQGPVANVTTEGQEPR